MKRVLSDFLLLTAFLTLCLTASAKPRSFKQAQSIAERQAQKLGIVIDQSSLESPKAERCNRRQHVQALLCLPQRCRERLYCGFG